MTSGPAAPPLPPPQPPAAAARAVSEAAKGVICGLGDTGYLLAVEAMAGLVGAGRSAK